MKNYLAISLFFVCFSCFAQNEDPVFDDNIKPVIDNVPVFVITDISLECIQSQMTPDLNEVNLNDNNGTNTVPIDPGLTYDGDIVVGGGEADEVANDETSTEDSFEVNAVNETKEEWTNDVVVGESTGIDEEKEYKIESYPNPCTDVLWVNSPVAEDVDISIFDLQGKLVFESVQNTLSHEGIDVRNLSNGIYVLHVSAASKVILTQKIVVRR